MKITKFAITIVAILLSATSGLAQDRKPISPGEISKYVVSAKAGLVNVVEGEASVTRAKPFAMPDMLISGDELLTGDTVKTGAKGRAEILLNPGSYLRLGEGSEFVFLFDSFTGNKIKLLRGSMVIEASAIDALILVETPKANFELARVGLYRFNVWADGKADVAVRKGRVLIGATTIKGGKRALVEGSTAAIAKLNKQDVDSLDDWSKNRARALIAANSRLSNRGMTRTLGMSLMYNTWIYDPFCRCYTFLPYAGGFSSPYGWNYPVCNPYWSYYSGRYNNGGWQSGGNGGGQPSSGGGSGGGSGSGGGGSSGGGRGGGTQPPVPTNPPDRTMGGDARSSERERPGPRRP
ncbi:MAG: FecR family protein [Acidobacteriota bacterium]